MTPLIPLASLTESRIRQQAADLRVSNPQLVENCLHAFLLLGYLTRSTLPFLFKGGTSILLHVPVIRRLSIDIDMVSPVAGEGLVSALRNIATHPPFKRLDEDIRDFRGQPNRRHFRFFYPSILRPGQERNVLMDVVEGDWGYLQHERKPVAQPWMDIAESAEVLVPTVPALLGDKLTAFAPNTIGVQYVNPMQGHLAGCSFGRPEAAIAAGKVAVLVEMLKQGKQTGQLTPESLMPPTDLTVLKDVVIQGNWSFLRAIKGTSPAGFHYWHQASMIRDQAK